ncbi:YaeQ family protein [Microbacterium aquilitoris]|uniref:YaeQ family protein n=1 Tax=Microbacterium aquilitoris TaxID=3067307 RepID=A0ABU3GH87_9MICO|nr:MULTISPECIES: YaeQ family protein [unclassified Microbacterium]MDT3329750.1 YaeQ family protein [Microbacterium sp. KSW-18]MDT3345584.1 YaeQ family protein [Microbacterium sp. KSW2-22]
MAIGSTMHTFTVHLADVDRGVYDELSLRLARHPSETAANVLLRVLAYALEYEEGIAFSEGISATAEPAVLVRDATGRMTAWIDVGAPDAARLHSASKAADRVAVYTHREPNRLAQAWAGKTIHRAADIPVYSFDRDFVDDAASALERRSTLTVSVTERQLYLDVNGRSTSSAIAEQRVG